MWIAGRQTAREPHRFRRRPNAGRGAATTLNDVVAPRLDDVPAALRAVGWNARVAALVEEAGAEVPIVDAGIGRVARVDQVSCLVATVDGERRATMHPLPAIGDWVLFDPAVHGPETIDDPGRPAHVLTAILPRWSELARGRGRDGLDRQVLAVNVDLVLVVVGLDRGVRARRLEREVLLAWDSGAIPIVVLTKADLHKKPERAVRQAAEVVPEVEIVLVNSKAGLGLDRVAELVRDHTAVFLGESGAGKSTLVNALIGVEKVATGEVRESDNKGKHTTTARHLFAVPTGGVIIDTPGVRALGLGSGEGFSNAYADIQRLAVDCRFRNCNHRSEPGCVVIEAIADGTLDPRRLAGFHRLGDELDRLGELADNRSGDPGGRPELSAEQHAEDHEREPPRRRKPRPA